MGRERSLIILGGAVRVVFGGMLVIAGREKLIAFGWWRQSVHELAFVPDTFEGVAAAVVPGIEIVTAIALLLGGIIVPKEEAIVDVLEDIGLRRVPHGV